MQSIKYLRANLKRWMRPQSRRVELEFRPGRARVVYQPLGGVGIISPWNLPVGLQEPIACHHQPQRAQRAKLQTAVVHLANFLTRAMGFGSGGDPWMPPLNHKAWSSLGLSMRDLEEIITELGDELEAVGTESLMDEGE